MRFIFALLLLAYACQPNILLAFPENVRHGYLSCSACHIAPSGGGVLTSYGRAQSAAFMSSFSFKRQEQPAYGLIVKQLPDYLAIGGDARYININLKGEGFEASQKFMMQSDMELAVSPLKGVTIDISGGLYGEKQVKEYRRNYLKLQLGDFLSLRAGRFIPAYGIGFPDHTLPTRTALGFGEGSESYNLEGVLSSSYGEFFMTGVFGNKSEIALEKTDGYNVTGDMIGIVSKAALYLGDRTQIGVSGLRLSSSEHYRRAYGGFIMTGFTDTLYLMAEYDLKDEDEKKTNLAVLKFGYEFVRGLHAIVTGDLNDKAKSEGFQLQWFPMPHWEILGELNRGWADSGRLDSGIFMLHYYL